MRLKRLVPNPGTCLLIGFKRSFVGIFFSFCIALLILLSAIPVAMAASQIMITPTRVVFSEKMRSASVTIINNGDSKGTYRISMVNKRMNEAGEFETNGGRVLAVVSQGGSREEAVERVYAEAGKVDFDGCQRRTDIGRLHFE